MQIVSKALDVSYPVSGITPFTSLDWPGHLCATFFVARCPWSCPYCHNKQLQDSDSSHDWDFICNFIEMRKSFLEGIVFSGGEPTLYKGLEEAMSYVKSKGLGVALHTGGSFPHVIESILSRNLVDWIGLDYKGPRHLYETITGDANAHASFASTLSQLLESSIPFEVRTTLCKEIVPHEIVLEMAGELASLGVKKWILQQQRIGNISGGFEGFPVISAIEELRELVESSFSIECEVRS